MTDETSPLLPEGEYAIVEQLGHRTFVGRVAEVERFGTKMLQVEPVFQGALLGPVLLGGSSVFAFTPCTREIAAARGAKHRYQLTPGVAATVPEPALPAPEPVDDPCTCDFENFSESSACPVHDAQDDFAPSFLDD